MKNEAKDVISTVYVPIAPEDYISGTTKSWSLPTKSEQYNYSGKLPYVNPDVYIKEVIYSDPATIVFWSDNTKTVCKCRYPDTYSKETGLTLCVLKKIFGGTKLKHLMEDWIPDQESFTAQRVTLRDVIKKNK